MPIAARISAIAENELSSQVWKRRRLPNVSSSDAPVATSSVEFPR